MNLPWIRDSSFGLKSLFRWLDSLFFGVEKSQKILKIVCQSMYPKSIAPRLTWIWPTSATISHLLAEFVYKCIGYSFLLSVPVVDFHMYVWTRFNIGQFSNRSGSDCSWGSVQS